MASEDARMAQRLLESAFDVTTKQPLADKGLSACDVKGCSDGVRGYVSTPGSKDVSVLWGERKAPTTEMKGKNASERMEKNVTYRAIAPIYGDVDVTAPAPSPARSPAKKVFLKKVGPLTRCRVLNTIFKDCFIPSTPVSRENDTKVVDGVLTDLLRVTRSEPTAAILLKL